MKPPRFDYAAPRTLGEAVSLLQQHEGMWLVQSAPQPQSSNAFPQPLPATGAGP